MHHSIKKVANSHFLDPGKFEEFAILNRDRYRVCGPDTHPTISTFHVDELVDAYKTSLGDQYEIDREEQISFTRSASFSR